jgi:cytochrome-b5 reductase
MWQVVSKILSNPEDKTEVDLVFANTSPKDILLKDDFDKMAKEHSNFRVHYVVDKAEGGWKGLTGYIDKEKVSKCCPPPSNDNLILVRPQLLTS